MDTELRVTEDRGFCPPPQGGFDPVSIIYRRDRGSRRMRAPQANMSIEITMVNTTRTPSAGMNGMHVWIIGEAQDAYIYIYIYKSKIET